MQSTLGLFVPSQAFAAAFRGSWVDSSTFLVTIEEALPDAIVTAVDVIGSLR